CSAVSMTLLTKRSATCEQASRRHFRKPVCASSRVQSGRLRLRRSLRSGQIQIARHDQQGSMMETGNILQVLASFNADRLEASLRRALSAAGVAEQVGFTPPAQMSQYMLTPA